MSLILPRILGGGLCAPQIITTLGSGPPPELIRTFGGFPFVASGNMSFTMPAGDVGQLLVVAICRRDAVPFTVPSGWTTIYQDDGNNAFLGDPGIHVAYKVREASEPTAVFTRSGGNRAAGFITGYEPNTGGLTFNTYTQAHSSGAATTNASTGSVSFSGSLSLIFVALSKSAHITTAMAGLSSASLSASASPGSFVSSTAAVGGTEWNNCGFISWSLSPIPNMQTFDLLAAGTGSTGTISISGITSSANHMLGASFNWT